MSHLLPCVPTQLAQGTGGRYIIFGTAVPVIPMFLHCSYLSDEVFCICSLLYCISGIIILLRCQLC